MPVARGFGSISSGAHSRKEFDLKLNFTSHMLFERLKPFNMGIGSTLLFVDVSFSKLEFKAAVTTCFRLFFSDGCFLFDIGDWEIVVGFKLKKKLNASKFDDFEFLSSL